jgi:hypothetical protein
MKNSTVLRAITAALIIVLTAAFNAEAGTVWIPTNSGEVDIQYYDFFNQYQFAIFDDSSSLAATDSRLELSKPADTIDFVQNGADWIISPHSNPANTLTLTNSNRFQLAMLDGTTWVADIGFLETSYGMYIIQWPRDITLLQIDAVPVPLPAGIYLLCVGVFTCAGLKKYIHGSGARA